MKALEWQRLLTTQTRLGKVWFTFTELANASGVPRGRLNVEMSRLVRYGVAVRYAKGLYGLAGCAVAPEDVLTGLDPHAYITGAYALMQQGFVTQVPALITCFTARRHFKRDIQTPVGRIEFLCVKPPVYRRGVRNMAGPEQALCDYVYIALRCGRSPVGTLTFRRSTGIRRSVLEGVLKRYPDTVRQGVDAVLGRSSSRPGTARARRSR